MLVAVLSEFFTEVRWLLVPLSIYKTDTSVELSRGYQTNFVREH